MEWNKREGRLGQRDVHDTRVSSSGVGYQQAEHGLDPVRRSSAGESDLAIKRETIAEDERRGCSSVSNNWLPQAVEQVVKNELRLSGRCVSIVSCRQKR